VPVELKKYHAENHVNIFCTSTLIYKQTKINVEKKKNHFVLFVNIYCHAGFPDMTDKRPNLVMYITTWSWLSEKGAFGHFMIKKLKWQIQYNIFLTQNLF